MFTGFRGYTGSGARPYFGDPLCSRKEEREHPWSSGARRRRGRLAAERRALGAKREELKEQRRVATASPPMSTCMALPRPRPSRSTTSRAMMSGSELFTGAAIDGLGQGPADDELSLWPDLDAITLLPWEPTVAWAPGDLHFHNEPYAMDSRTILRQQTDRLAEHGLQFNLGIETEFFLVQRDGNGIRPGQPEGRPPACRLRHRRPAGQPAVHGRGDRPHEPAGLGRPFVRPRGRQQPVRARLRLHRRRSRWPIASCSGG